MTKKGGGEAKGGGGKRQIVKKEQDTSTIKKFSLRPLRQKRKKGRKRRFLWCNCYLHFAFYQPFRIELERV